MSLHMVHCGILEWNVSVHSCFHDNMAAGQHFAGIMEDRENTHSTSFYCFIDTGGGCSILLGC